MTERAKIAWMSTTVPILLLWILLDKKRLWAVEMWSNIGIDITVKYDLFFFEKMKQHLFWYVHYSAYYYTLIVSSYVLWRSSFGIFRRVMFVLFVFSCARLLEYWAFRFHIGFISPVVGIMTFIMMTLLYYGKCNRV